MNRGKGGSASNLAARNAPHIETKIDFLECVMQRNGQSKNSCFAKMKSNQAHVSVAAPAIELGSSGNVCAEGFRIDPEIDHDEVTPFGG